MTRYTKDPDAIAGLSHEEHRVTQQNGTERPGTGTHLNTTEAGIYVDIVSGEPLFASTHKYESGCGWPSFDDELPSSVSRVTDADGRRTEIVCTNCDGHLGHVFLGEGSTPKNTRHCVNSVSIRFIEKGQDLPEVLGPE